MVELFKTTTADYLAILLPSVSALASVAAGILAFIRVDDCAAVLGIIGGITASGGIFAAYYAAKARDEQMRFWISVASEAAAQTPVGFGS